MTVAVQMPNRTKMHESTITQNRPLLSLTPIHFPIPGGGLHRRTDAGRQLGARSNHARAAI